MLTVRMAARNLFRSRRRSLVTVAAMAFALAIMVVYTGIMDGFMGSMVQNATMLDMGHLQIHAPGYRASPSIYERVPEPDKLCKKIEALGYHCSYRLFATALAAHGQASSGVQIRGVDPLLEARALELPSHVAQGKWLTEDDPKGVIIGKALARALDVRLSSEIVLVSQAADGSMANDLYYVRGILKTVSTQIDTGGLLMTARSFRELMVMESGAHEVAVTLPKNTPLDPAVAAVAALAPGLETLGWNKLNPAMAELIAVNDAFLLPMIVITYIAIAIIILNAMLMVVFERVKEYGLMKALGMTPWGVFRLVMAETAVLSVAAAALGLGGGLPLASYLESHGLNLSSFSESINISGVAMSSLVYAKVTTRSVLLPLVTLLVLVLLATLYPAIKASRLNPIDAMRHQ